MQFYFHLYVYLKETKQEYSIFYFVSAKEQAILSDTKPVMEESASVNDLSTLLLHTAMSWASESFQVFCTKHSIEYFLLLL